MFAILRADGPELRLKGIGCERTKIFLEDNLLRVELILHDIREESIEFMLRLDIHRRYRLTILDLCFISGCTAKEHDVKDLIHVLLKLCIDHRLIRRREEAEMDRLLRIRINRADKITID